MTRDSDDAVRTGGGRTAAQTSDFKDVAADPAAYYARPNDVLFDRSLTLAEKIDILSEWERDLVRKLESDGEGMGRQDADGSTVDGGALREAGRSLERLRGASDPQDPPVEHASEGIVARTWRRIQAFFAPDESGGGAGRRAVDADETSRTSTSPTTGLASGEARPRVEGQGVGSLADKADDPAVSLPPPAYPDP